MVPFEGFGNVTDIEVYCCKGIVDSGFEDIVKHALADLHAHKNTIIHALREYDWKKSERDILGQIHSISLDPKSVREYEIQFSINNYAADSNDDFGIFLTMSGGKVDKIFGAT